MSMTQMPSDDQNQPTTQRIGRAWQRLTAPIPSLKTISEQRRAQLLSILTLILSILLIAALIYEPGSYGLFLVLAGITLTSYALSRTNYYRLGNYLFAYAITATGYLRIYQGKAESIESAVFSIVSAALIFSSVLLSQKEFLGLVVLSTLAAFTAPLYSNIPSLAADNAAQTGGIVFAIGVILYGLNIFRENLGREEQKASSGINRKLEDIRTNLEQRIEEHTLELQESRQQIQKHAARLQTITEISQEISASVNLNSKELLTRITQSISGKLGYYHVGIFLMDKNLEYAELRAANSKGGQQMLARRHQLKVGGTGVVGYVAQSGFPRIALDTGFDAVFFNNPDLPETRSEMALPLKYGTSNIGVLDVQSTTPSAFNNEDVNTLNTLANQIAAVIRTLQILDEHEFESSPRKIDKRGSAQISRKEKHSGYAFTPDGTISSILSEKEPVLEKAIASSETAIMAQHPKGISPALAVPVKFRDQVIGMIHIESAEQNRKWTEDEVAMVQAVSDRAALALENARLFENATRRAEQEETIAQVTSRIGSSTDFNQILQTTIQELGQALGVSRSFIQLSAPSDKDDNDETTQ